MWGRLLVWACAAWEVWTAITTNSALFVSGPAYKNILPRRFLKDYMITRKQMISKGVSREERLLECGHLCLASTKCSSFLIQQDSLTCILGSLNRCQNNNSILLHSRGSFFYERSGGHRASPRTCFSSCFSHGGCHACGRPNCWGDRCQHCANHCWETPVNSSGETFLWGRGKRNIFSVFCDRGWHPLWRGGNSPPRKTPPNPLKLKLKLVYEGDVHVASYFASIYVRDKSLTVGAYLGGEAGNWWEAPFNDRKLAYNASLNCRPFFNPSSHCEANNIMSTEEQHRLKNQVVTRGYAWVTGREYYDNLRLQKIEMWMRCAECPDLEH